MCATSKRAVPHPAFPTRAPRRTIRVADRGVFDSLSRVRCTLALRDLLQEVMEMKATFLLAVSAASMLAVGSARAQDMAPTQGAMQQSAQGGQATPSDTSYGGTKPATMAGNTSRNVGPTGSASQCSPGLSCDIYHGQ